MTSKYEKTQGTKVSVSAAEPISVDDPNIVWLEAQCATKEISYTAGQKADIDVTTLCSEEQENTNGLPSPGEMTINRNWVGDEEAQESLLTAYETDERRAIKVVFPSGNGFVYLAEVRQNSWSAATSGVVSASYTLRLKGKPKRIKASDNVPVTGVTITPTSGTLAAGGTTTFAVNIAPADATNKGFTLSSSVPARAAASATGMNVTVSAPSSATAGAANIIVKTNDGDFTATFAATVTV
ncbi:phage tail tube protein [Serratia marcescens]|uniref:phage tail tube protein n=1 Tax=Serratia marcescens TaxID=615 RepID=UPI0028CE31C7|nr:phage tail tube protein [Serratia marcescens]MDT8208212.1 phage tail tube protein [Serratia marcescens]